MEKEGKYIYGIIPGLYKEQDEYLNKLLKRECDKKNLELVLVRCLNKMYEDYQKKVAALSSELNMTWTPKLKWPMPSGDLLSWFKNNFPKIFEDIEDQDREVILTYLYLWCQYQIHCIDKGPIEWEQPNLKKLYDNKNQHSYDRYGLIHIGGPIQLKELSPPRVYDADYDKTIEIVTNKSIVRVLGELFKDGKIGSLAFRGKDSHVFDGEMDREYIYAEMARGKPFSLDIEKLPDINMLYTSEEYGNQLWVIKTDTGIVFEEFGMDFEVEGDSIINQVIHLQYNNVHNSGYSINHMDHEYVFYSEEEYDNRRHGIVEKVKAQKRIKTFKLDDAMIPFDYMCDTWKNGDNSRKKVEVPFIYFVLNNYFQNEDLLNEYFGKIC